MSDNTPSCAMTRTEFQAMVTKANSGDRNALVRLRATLSSNPHLIDSVYRAAVEAESVLIDRIAGENTLVSEAVQKKLAQMRAELSGAGPTPLERLAVERVLTAWINVNAADRMVATDTSRTLRIGHYLLKRQQAAHRQYAAAVRMLTDIRKHSRVLKRQEPMVTVPSEPTIRIFDADDDCRTQTA